MNNIIYIGATNASDVFHVGMTSNGRSPELRWQDADYRGKLPYVPKRVAFYDVGDLRDEPVHTYILKDANVYSVKEEQGIRSDEIFRVDADNPAEYLQALVEEALAYHKTGIRPVDKFFAARPHQAWVNAQVLDKFDGTKTVVQPLNLAARFGKTLQGLDLFKKSGLQTMVMAGYWLSANQSFVDTIEKGRFDITSDVTVVKPDYQAYLNAIANGNRVFIDLSLHTDSEKIDERLINLLAKSGSFIYVDEADFGAWTDSSKATLNQFVNAGNNLVVIATGTNIDRALIGMEQEFEYPITVSYVDLIEAKRAEGILFDRTPAGPKEAEVLNSIRQNPDEWLKPLQDIVEVACVNLDASDAFVDSQNELSEEERVSMAKLFKKRNAHIQRQLIQHLLCDEDTNEDVFGLYETMFEPVDHPAVMVFIPGTQKDVDLFVAQGRRLADYINWVPLHGGKKDEDPTYTNRTAEKMVLDTIASGSYEKTVIVSCSMGARSFSVPNIVAVVNAVDAGSLGTAVQRSSRCLTPGLGKKTGLIVNYGFNTQRSSSFETDLISSVIRYDHADTESALRRVYGLVNFLKKDKYGDLVKLSEADFTEYVTCTENLENMAAATIDLGGLLTREEIVRIINSIIARKESKELVAKLQAAKTYIQETEKNKGEVDPEKKAVRELVAKLTTVIKTAGNLFYFVPDTTGFVDALERIDTDSDKSAEYLRLVGISARVILDNLVGHLPVKFLDLIIMRQAQNKGYINYQSATTRHESVFMDLIAGI